MKTLEDLILEVEKLQEEMNTLKINLMESSKKEEEEKEPVEEDVEMEF